MVDLAIVTSNFPAGKMHHLKQLDLEAATLDKVVRDAQGSTVSVKQPEDCADLQASLSRHRAKMHHYGMHCNPVLGLCLIKKDGSKYFIDELVFAALLRPFSVMNGGDTEFIFLSACTSHGYGMRLKQMGFVVVCWLTRVNDDAAQPFATAFYTRPVSRTTPPGRRPSTALSRKSSRRISSWLTPTLSRPRMLQEFPSCSSRRTSRCRDALDPRHAPRRISN